MEKKKDSTFEDADATNFSDDFKDEEVVKPIHPA